MTGAMKLGSLRRCTEVETAGDRDTERSIECNTVRSCMNTLTQATTGDHDYGKFTLTFVKRFAGQSLFGIEGRDSQGYPIRGFPTKSLTPRS
jgi:hypothetical protein